MKKNMWMAYATVIALFNMLLYPTSTTANITPPIQVVIEKGETKELLDFGDVEPFLVNDELYVPLRQATEQLGGKVAWDVPTRTATVSGNVIKSTGNVPTTFTMEADQRKIPVVKQTNNATFQQVFTQFPPKIVKNRLFVPLSLLTNGYQVKVEWDSVGGFAKITVPTIAQ